MFTEIFRKLRKQFKRSASDNPHDALPPLGPQELRKVLAGARLEMIDETAVQVFHFHQNVERVSATLGSRNGPVFAPSLKCKVTEEAKVIMSGGVLITLEKICLKDGILSAMEGPLFVRFKYTPGTPDSKPCQP
jgi:hypothetical protein